MTRKFLLVALIALSTHGSAATLSNLPGGPRWLSGVGQISMPSGLSNWESWQGYSVDIMTVWVSPMQTWTAFRSALGDTPDYFVNAMTYLPVTTPIVISYPLVPKEISNAKCQNPAMWDAFAAGDFDSHYKAFAQAFKALVVSHGRDPANHVIRLGWEMNGDWYPWSICDNVTEFKASWVRAVNIIRTEIPGIMIDFSPGHPYVGFTAGRNYNGGPGVDLEGFIPAVSSYDVISLSVHDGYPETVDDETWLRSNLNPPDSAKKIGLVDIAAVASSNGKKIALTEWGTQMTDCSSSFTASAEPALFIRKVFEFLEANSSLVAWDTHFSVSCTQLYGRQSTEAAQTYKSLWGSGTGGGDVSIDSGTDGNQDPVAPKPPRLLSGN